MLKTERNKKVHEVYQVHEVYDSKECLCGACVLKLFTLQTL